MALEGTHLRFALDLKEAYGVQDVQRYLSGTIYPDSRYVTKLERTLTHPRDYLEWDVLAIDDFRRGWFVHLLCDATQKTIMQELLPLAFEGDQSQGGEVWVRHTALKVLQDLEDVRSFNILSTFPLLAHVENPNGENLEELKRYNQIFPKMYAVPELTTFKSSEPMWTTFGMRQELVEKVERQTSAYAEDPIVMAGVKRIYPEMLVRTKSTAPRPVLD